MFRKKINKFRRQLAFEGQEGQETYQCETLNTKYFLKIAAKVGAGEWDTELEDISDEIMPGLGEFWNNFEKNNPVLANQIVDEVRRDKSY